MMNSRVLSSSDFESLIVGATILGTGGGGSKIVARELAGKILDSGKQATLVPVDEIPEDEICAIIGMAGGGVSEQELQHIEGLEELVFEPMIEAVKLLEKHLFTDHSKGFFGFYATEMGPENIMLPIFAAVMLGKYVVDGDACGRSKPEISISTTHVYGLPITPLSVVSRYGDYIILENAQNDFRAEKIVRHFSIMSGGEVACCRCPALGKDLKAGAIIPGTISKAIELGDAVLKGRDNNVDLVNLIVSKINGKLLFRGRVAKFERFEKGGFTSGHIVLEGSPNSDFSARHIAIYYKNEYIYVSEKSEIIASVPDSIIVIDAKTGEGLSPWTNDFLVKDREIAVLWKEAAPIWKTDKGLEIFGLKHFEENG